MSGERQQYTDNKKSPLGTLLGRLVTMIEVKKKNMLPLEDICYCNEFWLPIVSLGF